MWRFFHSIGRAVATGFGRPAENPKPPPISLRGPALAATVLFGLVLIADGSAQSLQSITGRVVDAHDSAPIAGARVRIEGTAWEDITDEDGSFAFYGLPLQEYSLSVSAEGYKEASGVGTEVAPVGTMALSIKLERRLTILKSIEVRADRSAPTSESMVVLGRADIDDTRAHCLPDVLEQVPGVQVETDGGGQAHVTIRGSKSEQVLILMDGHRLNPASGGQADLSSISLEMVERIEVYKESASARFGADAMAGAINIISRSSSEAPMTASLDQQIASWNDRRSSLVMGAFGEGHWFSLNGSVVTRRAEGDFPFVYSVEPSDTTIEDRRLNNDNRSDNYFVSGSVRWGYRTTLSASLQVYESSHGLPGEARDQNAFARRSDDRRLLTFRFDRQLTDNTRLVARLGWSRLAQELVDLGSAERDRFQVDYVDQTFTEGLALVWERDDRWLMRLGAEGSQQRLDHEDHLSPRQSTGITDRAMWSGFLVARRVLALPSAAWFSRLEIDGTLRYDDATTTPKDTTPTYPWEPPRRATTVARWTPYIGAALTRGGDLKATLRASHGSSFRLPSINALFWSGDAMSSGNPDLRPEVMLSTSWGVSVRYEKAWYAIEVGATWFHRRADDLVQWVQSDPSGVWKPVNLGRARITGREDIVRVALWDERLAVEYQNALTEARNRVSGRNSYDKYLTHTPAYTTQLAVTINIEPIRLQYTSRWVGRRWATAANTKWYDGHRLDDLDLSLTLPLSSSWRLTGQMAVKNLLDENYVVVTHHPMPGRHWRAGLKVSYNPAHRGKR